jgi:glycosyltransferase involved in cell wall biosynthesis
VPGVWQISSNTFKKKMEKVSIIIPYKEDRGFLTEAVRSVERQTYKNIELIMSKSDHGVSWNLNRGIEKSTGRYVKYLCDDDRLPVDSIEHSVRCISKGFDFIHGNAVNFFPDGQSDLWVPNQHTPSMYSMLRQNRIHGGTLMYDRKVFEQHGQFNESLWTGEEYEFNLRLLSRDASIGYCPKVLYWYRRHVGQKSIGNMDPEYQARRYEVFADIRAMYAEGVVV